MREQKKKDITFKQKKIHTSNKKIISIEIIEFGFCSKLNFSVDVRKINK